MDQFSDRMNSFPFSCSRFPIQRSRIVEDGIPCRNKVAMPVRYRSIFIRIHGITGIICPQCHCIFKFIIVFCFGSLP